MNRPQSAALPQIAVVIPTRNRGAEVLPAVRSVLANETVELELVVVDQSSAEETARTLAPLAADPRLTILRSATEGISAARNVGIAAVRAQIVALTDDDCEVPTTWCGDLVEAFGSEADLGVLFGNVTPGPHDPTKGFVPASCTDRRLSTSRVQEMHRLGGMGACMAIRRSVWERLGGFDERLGAGTHFGAGEEGEFLLRALLAGYSACRTPSIEVVHNGFRTWEEGRSLIHRYWFGAGATLGIHVSSSPGSVGGHLMALGWGWLTRRSDVAESLGDRPHRLLRLTSFLKGFFAGLPLRAWGARR